VKENDKADEPGLFFFPSSHFTVDARCGKEERKKRSKVEELEEVYSLPLFPLFPSVLFFSVDRCVLGEKQGQCGGLEKNLLFFSFPFFFFFSLLFSLHSYC